MDLNDFLRQRRLRWQRFSVLLDMVDKTSLEALGPREADEFFSLYRLTSSDLNLVQTRTGNPSLLEYLEGLVARAYGHLSIPRRARFFQSWWLILRHDFPAALRSQWKLLLTSFLATAIGVICGFASTFAQPSSADIFLPAEHLQQSPRERVAHLEDLERNGNRSIASADDHMAFTVFLFNNNIRVSILAFALGLTFGVGTIIMLFYNGAMLGSLAALYILDGETKFFIAWIGPHGSIELPCVMFAGTAGLMLAARQLRRRDGSFISQVRAIRPMLVDILVGTSTLLVLAGCIEGGFSQINEPTISYTFKIIVAIVLFSALLAYLFIMPVNQRSCRVLIDR
jgi:uncharacterized membrane protein SpoIIM required for sporulation